MQPTIPQLIEEAAHEMGSEYKLAQKLGITPQELSGMKYGRRACPPDLVAVMTQIRGGDPVSALIEAVKDRLSDERKARLEEALETACGLTRIFPQLSRLRLWSWKSPVAA